MNAIFILFWALLVFGSILWYGILVFYVGFAAGWEIRAMTRSLGRDSASRSSTDNAAEGVSGRASDRDSAGPTDEL